MAEITSPDYPGERLVVCKNPLLAEERARKREELLAVTENDLARIAARVQRPRSPLRGAAAIGLAVGAVLGRRHMAKHFQISITDATFSFAQNPLSIVAEAVHPARVSLATKKTRPFLNLSASLGPIRRSRSPRWVRPDHRRLRWRLAMVSLGLEWGHQRLDPFLTNRDATRCQRSAIGGQPGDICSLRALLPVTRSGHGQAIEIGKNLHLDIK